MCKIQRALPPVLLSCMILSFLVCACSDDDGEENNGFKAGFAMVDITPEVDVILAGYDMALLSYDRCRWSTGVHDPLYASAVAFDDRLGGKVLILIVLDNVGMITNEVKEIQAGVAGALGLDEESIVVSATHTHHGPDTIGLFGVIIPPMTGRQEDVIDMMVAGAVQAGIEAWNARAPARLEYAVGTEPRFHFNKITGDPDAVIDSTMTVLAAYTPGGRLIGTLMNWAAHPTLLANGNTLISADYPGAYYKHMAETLDGIHIFINGAVGASIQALAVENGWWKWLFSSADWDDWDDFGIALTEDVVALMAEATPVDEPSIGLLESRKVQVKVDNLIFWLAATVGLIPREVPPVGEYGTSYMTTFAIGPVTFGTVPGEYVPDYSFNLREIMGGEAQFVIGLGMDWIGYAITPDQYAMSQYLYERFLCPSSQAGEELLEVYREVWDPVHDR